MSSILPRKKLLGPATLVLALLTIAIPEARAEHRTLPAWQDGWSDGCSFSPDVNDRVRAVCVRHDTAYYYGGSERDRLTADQTFRKELRETGLWGVVAYVYYRGVRTFGVPWLKIRNVSWSFGGEYFAYSDHPATPIPAPPSG